ncbi:hypothetical protein ACMHYB_17220 [Sorangium sp. So ce1128]
MKRLTYAVSMYFAACLQAMPCSHFRSALRAPAQDARKALRAWLYGIAWRKTGHYLHSAWVRRAVLQ